LPVIPLSRLARFWQDTVKASQMQRVVTNSIKAKRCEVCHLVSNLKRRNEQIELTTCANRSHADLRHRPT
jgi:hypothetical protein